MNINVLLFKQIRSNTESFGYVVNGYDEVTMRSEQRFEEFGHFINAAVNAVNNNRKLIMTSRTNELLSEQDFLTGLYNRRGFFTMLKKLLNVSANSGRILSLFSIDMDKLKTINDTYGHENGDVAIQTLARAILKYVKDDGIAARYGGDEFAFAIIGDHKLEGEIKKIRNEIEESADSDPAMNDKPSDSEIFVKSFRNKSVSRFMNGIFINIWGFVVYRTVSYGKDRIVDHVGCNSFETVL